MDGEKSNKNHQVIQTLSPRNPKQITKKSKKFTEISIKITAKSIFCLEYWFIYNNLTCWVLELGCSGDSIVILNLNLSECFYLECTYKSQVKFTFERCSISTNFILVWRYVYASKPVQQYVSQKRIRLFDPGVFMSTV